MGEPSPNHYYLERPRAPGSPADIEASVKTLVRIRDDISHADLVNRIEWLKKQPRSSGLLRPAKAEDKTELAMAEEEDEYDAHPSKAPRPLSEAQEKKK
jgi:hypothetical protein